MSPWVLRLLMVCPALLVVGFGLVLASGYSGDNGGGSELVWRVGGLMVYASIPVSVTALVWGLISSHRSARPQGVTPSASSSDIPARWPTRKLVASVKTTPP
jgi:hypothetical protein